MRGARWRAWTSRSTRASRAQRSAPWPPPSLPARRSASTAEAASGLRGGDFDPAELAAGRGDVLLVGHEPDFSRAIQRATGARVTMKKGGLAAVEDGVLVSLVRPRQIRAIADG